MTSPLEGLPFGHGAPEGLAPMTHMGHAESGLIGLLRNRCAPRMMRRGFQKKEGDMRKAIMTAVAVAVMALSGVAGAASVADNQGFCKKQGPSSCAGGSECSASHRQNLPAGQEKKC